LKLAARSKLVMVGDSITDAGRAKPVGEGRGDAIGKGYVMMVEALLGAVYTDQWIRVVNQGISGNTVRDLKARWQTDVLDLSPDWVSVMIGTNDVWRQFDSPRQTEIHVLIDEYERTLEELVLATLPKVKGMVLMTPFYIEPNRADAMRAAMDRYGGRTRWRKGTARCSWTPRPRSTRCSRRGIQAASAGTACTPTTSGAWCWPARSSTPSVSTGPADRLIEGSGICMDTAVAAAHGEAPPSSCSARPGRRGWPLDRASSRSPPPRPA
jgi:lysophospholipase L1-like esterase